MQIPEANSQCEKYFSILAQEYEQAKKDVQTARSTFHYGLRDAMIARGYTVASCGDNSIYFYGASRLFKFRATNYETCHSPWKLSDKVMITFSNYSWKERYQYPCYYHDINYIDLKIDNFKSFYLSTCDDCDDKVSLLEQYKTESEKAESYKSFKVFSNGDYDKLLGTFDNPKDALKFAYDYAQKQCNNGKKSDLRRYYHYSPVDITKKYSYNVATYEYYLYDEYSYYIYVDGEN